MGVLLSKLLGAHWISVVVKAVKGTDGELKVVKFTVGNDTDHTEKID